MARRNQIFILTVFLGMLFSCSFRNTPEKKFSLPDWKENLLDGETKKILVAFSGDLNADITGKKEKLVYQDNKALNFLVGGIPALKAHLEIIRKKFSNNALIFDLGHLWTEYPIDPNEMKTVASFYESDLFDAVLFTDQDIEQIRENNKEGTIGNAIKFLTSNVLSLQNQNAYQYGNSVTEKVFEIHGQKIGVIGINYPIDYKYRSLPVITGLVFEDPILGILKAKKNLKAQNVTGTILLLNIPSQCSSNISLASEIDLSLVPDPDLKCPTDDPLVEIIHRFPKDAVDLILLTPGPNFLFGTINSIPVARMLKRGQYLGLAQLSIDPESGKIKKEKTIFHNPIKLCHQFVLSTQDCYRDEFSTTPMMREASKQSDLVLVPAKFLGHEVDIKN